MGVINTMDKGGRVGYFPNTIRTSNVAVSYGDPSGP